MPYSFPGAMIQSLDSTGHHDIEVPDHVSWHLESFARHNHHPILPNDALHADNFQDSLMDEILEAARTRDPSRIIEIIVEQRSQARAEGAIGVLTVVTGDERPDLACACLCLAAGLGLTEGLSDGGIAKRWGITKAAVSKRVIDYSDRIGIHSANMKSEKARESYRANKLGEGHWRRQKLSSEAFGLTTKNPREDNHEKRNPDL